MRQLYPDKIQKEEKRLMSIILSSDEGDFDLEKFIEENASEEYKAFMQEKEKRDKELLSEGIIEG